MTITSSQPETRNTATRNTALACGVADYLSHLAVERGLAANTLLSYRRDLRRYVAFLATREIDNPARITEADVLAFLGALRSGGPRTSRLGAASAARTLVAARGLHKFLLREGTIDVDVTSAVKPPTPPKRLPKALPLADVEALLDAAAAPGTTLSIRDRALLELLYGTGARISEAVGLDVDDIDLESGSLLLRGKGSKQRIVPLGSYAQAAIETYLRTARPMLVSVQGSLVSVQGGPASVRGSLVSVQGGPASVRGSGAAVFLNARGGRLSRQSAWTVLHRAAGRCGLASNVSPHTLRHSFATHLLDGGADVRVVQDLLGHASVTTTQIYTLVTVDKLREIYATAHPRARVTGVE